MAETNFVDYVKIFVRSGKGGPGAVHFYRDKFTARGGPDGGDGGRGGHIIVRGNKQLWTLLHLKYRKHIHAADGEPGMGRMKTGADGADQVIEVPLGTVVKDFATGKVQCEITSHGQEFILLRGGRGGRGNAFFKTPTLQAPRFAQPGEPGQEGWKIFELKLLADVGLVGFPNAGKSTLLAAISAARPEIADYPFTTLVPHLGLVAYRDFKSFVVADIPGIIEGAHMGRGLGLRFLRHIERNSVLLFMIPADCPDHRQQYHILLNELEKYNPELLKKQRVIGISKSDLLDADLEAELAAHLNDLNPVFFSAVTGTGLEILKDRLWQALNTPSHV
ncbi:MAG: GTPase ObgE [Flavobacteriales bacterium]|nr:GTPase ObgE [Flavobacteriales bacterium]MDW8409842.1 GTPase ObgE [Flavobacteriales bacterium]